MCHEEWSKINEHPKEVADQLTRDSFVDERDFSTKPPGKVKLSCHETRPR